MLRGVSTLELVHYMKKEYGMQIDVDPIAKPSICMVVLGMGWSWACYFAQIISENAELMGYLLQVPCHISHNPLLGAQQRELLAPG